MKEKALGSRGDSDDGGGGGGGGASVVVVVAAVAADDVEVSAEALLVDDVGNGNDGDDDVNVELMANADGTVARSLQLLLPL